MTVAWWCTACRAMAAIARTSSSTTSSSGTDRTDRLQWAKFVSLAWLKDGSGFFYTRFPEPGTVPVEQENYFCRLYFHRIGDPQDADRLVCERPDDPMVVFEVDVTDDGRHLVVVARHGASDRSEIWIRDLADPDERLVPIFTGFEAAWHFVGSRHDRFFFITDAGAPLGRLVGIRQTGPAFSAFEETELIAEGPDRLSAAAVAGDRLVTVVMHDATDRLRVHHLDGAFEREIAMPEPGSILELSGRADDEDAFVQFTSFTRPPTVFRFGVRTGAVEEWDPVSLPVDPAAYETTQVWVTSKDGTQVPMFLVRRKDVGPDGGRPVLLGGYGGFNISYTPEFDPGAFLWLDRGGVVAVVNLRGGGEFGEAWHQAGMLERKQNVFDDFIAAAEWLVANGWSRPDRIAIEGGSNGGLLVGAVMTQRPELFGAVICRVPVADMLRYHLWTVGRFWIAEYRLRRRSGAVPLALRLLAVSQRPRGDRLSAHAGDDGRHRRSRGAGHGEEVRRPPAGRHHLRRADPDPGGDPRRPRRRQVHHPEDRGRGGYLRVSVQVPEGRVGLGQRLEPFEQRWLPDDADNPVDLLAVLEDEQRRDAEDVEAAGGGGVLVDVQLGHAHASGHLGGQLVDDRRDHPAGAAPRGPQVDQHGHRRLLHVARERGVAHHHRPGRRPGGPFGGARHRERRLALAAHDLVLRGVGRQPVLAVPNGDRMGQRNSTHSHSLVLRYTRAASTPLSRCASHWLDSFSSTVFWRRRAARFGKSTWSISWS